MPTRQRRRRTGFTLIEMLVVLTIISMGLAVAPAVMAGLDGSRLRAAAFELIAHLREARGLARLTETPTELRLNLDRKVFTVSFDPRVRPLPTVVDAVSVTPPGLIGAARTDAALGGGAGGDADRIVRIRFQPDGSATAARVTLRRGGSSATIAIDPLTGRIWRDG